MGTRKNNRVLAGYVIMIAGQTGCFEAEGDMVSRDSRLCVSSNVNLAKIYRLSRLEYETAKLRANASTLLSLPEDITVEIAGIFEICHS